jgi:predicted transposase YbfD/YdcC
VLDQFDLDDVIDVPAAPAVLLAALRSVPDPRQRQGLRHELDGILTLVACAVVAGSRSFVAIAEWAEAATPHQLGRLGIPGEAPSESTIRRTLQRLDADGLDVILGAWTALHHVVDPQHMQVIALDGKTLRGARGPDGRGRHLLAALAHDSAIVLGQLDVNGKTNEIPMLPKLLDTIDIIGALITADALHTQTAHADYLVTERGAHYLLTVKRNQPTLHTQLVSLPWTDIPVTDIQHDRAHGREEKRTLKTVTVAAGIGFPHARQAIQITRKRRRLDSKKWSTETVYAITDLAPEHAPPRQLQTWLRGHWAIETSLHWVRDVTFGEDHSQTRTRSGPQVMASIRNLAINLLRLSGATNIAAALRHHARTATNPIKLVLNS